MSTSPDGKVNASPSKRFFVHMLTRDIELEDAILDLLDNCLDGVLRSLKASGEPATGARPYEGFYAKISANPDEFIIRDNCGGIPEKVAREYAFMLGRPSERDNADRELPTIGMYGIGMKRAIFKMGRECVVTSNPRSTPGDENPRPFRVHIPVDWFTSAAWTDLPLYYLSSSPRIKGTTVHVTKIVPEIARLFDRKRSNFLTDLKARISERFSRIIDKGFAVTLNDESLESVPLTLLAHKDIGYEETIDPYVHQETVEGVSLNLAVGFFRPYSQEDLEEPEDDQDQTKWSARDSGWTVVCNDRIVLYNDKSHLTGWGTGGLPAHHNQYYSIRGVAFFRSDQSRLLPLTTTKRGVETSSAVYQVALDSIREGTKLFTTFTNHWKKRMNEVPPLFKGMKATDAETVARYVDPECFSRTRKRKGLKFVPSLPRPERAKSDPRLCFKAPPDQIALVCEYLGVDKDELARACFDDVLTRAEGVES